MSVYAYDANGNRVVASGRWIRARGFSENVVLDCWHKRFVVLGEWYYRIGQLTFCEYCANRNGESRT